MSRYSSERGVNLLTVDECAQLFGKSVRTIKRALKAPGVYVEQRREVRPGTRGTKVVNYIDPATLPFKVENAPLKVSEDQFQRIIEVSEDHGPEVSEGRGKPTEASHGTKVSADHALIAQAHKGVPLKLDVDLSQARSRLEQLRPIMALPEGKRHEAIEVLAQREGVSMRTVYRWIRDYQTHGLRALGRKQRADRGRIRIPQEAYQLIVQALISNTPATSAKMLHRTLLRAVPEVMSYQRGGKTIRASEDSVRRIRRQIEADPHLRYLIYDADKRKEHLRTYAGQVFAAHANELWQMDMTRCDVIVCDPESGKIFRPRIHAIIDVYSGCIPGLAFALEEDQTQTDLVILRALVPKPAPYTDAWPVWGTPARMYWDNGKTYGSEHARRVLSELGIEVVYSKPRVSHTRGKIERFFGTFHGYEKTLPGYVGTDAKNRATEELRRLTRNTRRWLGRGLTQDPGWGNRLLTLGEYQERVMDWLLVEYHPWVVHGQSRLQHFLETVPPRTQSLYSREELMLVLARRTTRVVNPDGSIRLNNRYWTVESGELINYVNREVLVLTNQFAAGEEHLIAWREPSGALRPIGAAVPMPERADSDEARAQRIRSTAAAQRAQRHAKAVKGELTNPNTVVSNVLREHAQAELQIAPLPSAERPAARLAAVNPNDELPDDDFTRFILSPPDYGTDDPAEIIRRAIERRKGVNRG